MYVYIFITKGLMYVYNVYYNILILNTKKYCERYIYINLFYVINIYKSKNDFLFTFAQDCISFRHKMILS